uniref:(California timema) hypothetical protein n=1 Tax=Timema californicum TaxID=61474 RepID=A0A7R9P5D5_TIMCA|nr:unnamed protein product [Timema californicum]
MSDASPREMGELAQGDRIPTRDDSGSISPRTMHQHGEGDSMDLLEPKHPLMKRFQAALKAHLERQLLRLSEEVLELEAALKGKQVEREDLGVELYNLQQEVTKQQCLLDNYHDTLDSMIKTRQETETRVHAARMRHKAEAEKLNKAERKEEELRSELESLMLLEKQFSDWEKDMESDLTVSQRISEKTKVDKKQLADDKRRQDIFLLKLMTEVSNLSSQNSLLDTQFRVKDCERATIGQTVADANADLQALGQEQHRLLQSWNGVVINIKQRDRVYEGVQKELEKAKEQFLNVISEIEGLKKSCTGEMELNEKLTLALHRHKTEVASTQRSIGLELDKKNNAEMQLSLVANMMEQTEKDLGNAINMYHQLTAEDKLAQQEVEKLSNEKVQLEDAILQKLQCQITQDKAGRHMNKQLFNLRDKTRSQEVQLFTTENLLAQTSLQIEQHRGANSHNELLLEELERELNLLNKELIQVERDLKQSKFLVGKKQGAVDTLNKKLESMVSKTGTEVMSPEELKINNLNKKIDETTEQSKKLQQFWLRQQGHIVQLSHQRDEQLHEIDILRKRIWGGWMAVPEVLVMEQKNLKIEQEIERYNKEEHSVGRSIKHLLHKLVTLNLQLCQRRGYKEELDKDNVFIQGHYLNVLKGLYLNVLKVDISQCSLRGSTSMFSRQVYHSAHSGALPQCSQGRYITVLTQGLYLNVLKDAEMESVKLEAELRELEQEKIHLSDRVMDSQRESLAWEKKLQMAVENKMRMDQERSKEGEIGNMKAEIHRMEVRYSQLKGVQRRLVLDLEQCVSRREAIVDVADAREKRNIRGANNVRINFQKKLEDLQNKLKQVNSQIKSVEQDILDAEKNQQSVLEQLSVKQDGLKGLEERNLELLIRRQHKVKMYEDVKRGRHKLLFRSEASLNVEHQHQKIVKSELISIVETLMSDFPLHRVKFGRILNYLTT